MSVHSAAFILVIIEGLWTLPCFLAWAFGAHCPEMKPKYL